MSKKVSINFQSSFEIEVSDDFELSKEKDNLEKQVKDAIIEQAAMRNIQMSYDSQIHKEYRKITDACKNGFNIAFITYSDGMPSQIIDITKRENFICLVTDVGRFSLDINVPSGVLYYHEQPLDSPRTPNSNYSMIPIAVGHSKNLANRLKYLIESSDLLKYDSFREYYNLLENLT